MYPCLFVALLVAPCDRSEPSDVGMVTLSTFLQFWGVVFLATTVFVCFFKPEVENGVNDKVLGLADTYSQVKAAFLAPIFPGYAIQRQTYTRQNAFGMYWPPLVDSGVISIGNSYTWS